MLELGHLYRLHTGELVAPFHQTDRDYDQWRCVVLVPGKIKLRGGVMFVSARHVLHEEWPLTDRDRDGLAARILVAQV
jgi:hypothetical protein